MSKYILVNFTSNSGKHTFAFENFEEVKESVTDVLDCKGWADKAKVDLRSLDSCINYLCCDYRDVDYCLSNSNDKFCAYRYGSKSKAL